MNISAVSVPIGHRNECGVALLALGQSSARSLVVALNVFPQRLLSREAFAALSAEKGPLRGPLLNVPVSESNVFLQSRWRGERGVAKRADLVPLSAVDLFVNRSVARIRKRFLALSARETL